ncbi:MAG: hypothetical protein [Ixodes ricinus noda-like-virus 1]|nr:MAG: hypothetical protein [Ixodes ricinus noda-like-virus 1]
MSMSINSLSEVRCTPSRHDVRYILPTTGTMPNNRKGRVLQVVEETKRRPRRRRRSRRRAKPAVVVSDTPTSVGVVEKETVQPRGPKGRMFRSIAPLTHNLTPAAKEFIHRHCNPCGEMVTFREHAKVPDAALPNSTALELRQVTIVRCPNQSDASVTLDGKMWCLTVIHLPLFRTPMILIGNVDNVEMTAEIRAQLCATWNGTESPPVYPDWEVLQGSFYWCVVKWSGLDTVEAPTVESTRAIEQFRITSDGVTIFNNTPDLINQGMVVGAQWTCNQAVSTVKSIQTDAGDTINVRFNSNVNGTFVGGSFRLPVDLNTITRNSVGDFLGQVDPNQSGASFRYIGVRMGAGSATGSVFTVTAETTEDLLIAANTFSKGSLLTITMTVVSGIVDPNLTGVRTLVTLTPTSAGATPVELLNTLGKYDKQIAVTFVDGFEPHQVSRFQLPPTTTEGVIQSTPKAVYMSMKEQNGVYMVKRIFQPIFGVQRAAENRTVHMVTEQNAGDFENYPFGIRDTFDLNYGVGVIIMNSIPHSCAPAFKMIRDVEIVAGDSSAFQLFMTTNTDECQAAIEVVKAINEMHPFMYPESYNVLGGLMSMISNVVGKIPLLGSVANVVKPLVGGLLGNTESNGQSQNRLASTNVEELSKLLPMLLQQLGIGR